MRTAPCPSRPVSLEPLAPHTVPAAEDLGLDDVRARGYATAVEELEPGLWAVAAPVRDATGAVVAALSVSGPTVRLRRGLLHRLGRLLVRKRARSPCSSGTTTESEVWHDDPIGGGQMSDDEIDLESLSDEDLVAQMHDDLYDGLPDEIVRAPRSCSSAAGRPTGR